jgi:hypothetical protein
LAQKKNDPEIGRSVDPAEVGGLHQVVSEHIFRLYISGEGGKRRRQKTQSCTLCVTDSQHNAAKKTRSTFSQPCCRKGDARVSCARMEAMEAAQRRAPDVGDVSDAESEEVEVEEAAGEDVAEERLLRAVAACNTVVG